MTTWSTSSGWPWPRRPAQRPAQRPARAGMRRNARLRLAETSLAEAVRQAARTRLGDIPVAAVLSTGRLPLDIRHASKVDRREVARLADRLLAGTGA